MTSEQGSTEPAHDGEPFAPDRDWLARPALEVAPELLGALLTAVSPGGVVTIRVTEVEAYEGEVDPGSHAFRGRTARNAVMFGRAGHLYVYRHMGLHHCANVVTGTPGTASAVLLRAGEVVEGASLARSRRTARGAVRSEAELASGPARLATALGLDLTLYGTDLLDPRAAVRLMVVDRAGQTEHRTGPRVGVGGDGGDALRFPWRFWLPDDPTVSRYRPAPPPRHRRASRGPSHTAD